MRKNSLAEHLDSVDTWHTYHVQGGYSEERHQTCLMIAYERWINDRDLLMDEDPEFERVDPADVNWGVSGPGSRVIYRRKT